MKAQSKRRASLCRDANGSLSVEAVLILPLIFLLMVLLLRWGMTMRNDIRDTAEGIAKNRREYIMEPEGGQLHAPEAGLGFLYGSKPARRIRDADTLIDLGHSIKERLPSWLQK